MERISRKVEREMTRRILRQALRWSCIALVMIVQMQPATAQRFIGADELSKFRTDCGQMKSLDEYDRIDSATYIMYSHGLRDAGVLTLPPSEWQFIETNGRNWLCWTGLTKHDDGQEAHIRELLLQQFGCITGGDGAPTAIPALWFTGALCTIRHPVPKWGLWIMMSKYGDRHYSMDKGLVMDDADDDMFVPWAFLDDSVQASIEQMHTPHYGIGPIIEEGFSEIHSILLNHAAEGMEEARKIELLLLANNISLMCPTRFPKSENHIIDMPVFVETCQDGRHRLHVLCDTTAFNQQQQRSIQQLVHAFALLPRLSYLHVTYSLDGIIRGDMLYASHEKSFWTFADEPRETE